MEIVKKREVPIEKQVALVLGNFDGFHRGHMTLLEEAKAIGRRESIPAAVFSFEPHPSFVLSHKDPVDLINTREEKEHVFESLGMTYYFEFPFTIELAELSPTKFIEDLLLKQVKPHTVIVGEDYRFGNKRSGDIWTLQVLGKHFGFEVVVMPKLNFKGRDISSSWIRNQIKSGDLELANLLLGRPFFINGIVAEGAKIGRTIGYPTANIIPKASKLLPPFGVYVTKVTIDGNEHYGLTNVGDRPTVDTVGVTVETFILDFDQMIYGEAIKVEFMKYIRPEERFDSLEALKTAIDNDLEVIKTYRKKAE